MERVLSDYIYLATNFIPEVCVVYFIRLDFGLFELQLAMVNYGC
jgi:hypothetical protein